MELSVDECSMGRMLPFTSYVPTEPSVLTPTFQCERWLRAPAVPESPVSGGSGSFLARTACVLRVGVEGASLLRAAAVAGSLALSATACGAAACILSLYGAVIRLSLLLA